MKNIMIYAFVWLSFSNCSEKKEVIHFIPLKENEFNQAGFKLPMDSKLDSLKRAHDSCMGFSFGANAMLIQKRDTFLIGSVVNKQSLSVVNTLQDLGLSFQELFSQFSLATNPCYVERALPIPVRSIFKEKLVLNVPTGGSIMSKEINDAISASTDAKITTGSWVYLDMTDVLKRILDTAKGPKCLEYRNNLLDTANMTLTAVENIMNIRFSISTKQPISDSLQSLLKPPDSNILKF